MSSNYKWTIRFSVLTPILILICVFLMGGGHGWYRPTMLLFPWATLNHIWQDHFSKALVLAGIFQFIAYGLIIDKTRGTNYRKIVIAGILVTHIVLAVFILVFKNPEWR